MNTPVDPEVFGELVDRLGAACAEAVDPMELAAVLESEGVTDAVAATKYGVANVFELADLLFARTIRDPAPVNPDGGPWQVRPWLHLARGVLFVLPGLAYAAAGELVRGTAAVSVVLVCLVLSWTYAQTVGYLGYARLGVADCSGAERLLRRGLLLAVGVIVAVVATIAAVSSMLPVGVPAAALGVAAAQAAYLVAATVVLVCAREGLLALALAPSAVCGLAWKLGWVSATVAMAASVASVAVTIAVAGYVTSRLSSKDRSAKTGTRLNWAEFRQAVPHGAFGLVAAGLLVFVPASATWFGTAGTNTGRAVVLALPLTFSMGSAEWIMVWYRSAMHRVANRARGLVAFRIRAVVRLSAAFGAYLMALGAVMVVTAFVIRSGLIHRSAWTTGIRWDVVRLAWTPRLHPGPGSVWLVGLAGYLALGGALFLAMLLVAARICRPVLVVCATAVCGEYLAVAQGHPALMVQLVTAVVATAALFACALVGLSRAARHI